MITIMITEDELKAKKAIAKLLQEQGYSFSQESGSENVIRLVKKDSIRDME